MIIFKAFKLYQKNQTNTYLHEEGVFLFYIFFLFLPYFKKETLETYVSYKANLVI